MDDDAINLTDILNIEDDYSDIEDSHNHYLLDSPNKENPHIQTTKNLNDFYSHSTHSRSGNEKETNLFSTEMKGNSKFQSQDSQAQRESNLFEFMSAPADSDDNRQSLRVANTISELLGKVQQIEKQMSNVQTQNRTLSILIASNGNIDKVKKLLVNESNDLRRKNQLLQQTINNEQTSQHKRIFELTSELKELAKKEKIPANIRLPIIKEENIRLKHEQLRLQRAFQINGSTREESQSIVQKMEVEAMEREVARIRNKSLNIERSKLRPLSRKLTMLNQKNQDLVWALNDKQSLDHKNKFYLSEIMAMETLKLKDVKEINKCYNEQILKQNKNIDLKKNKVQQISVINFKIRKDSQDLMEAHTVNANSMRGEHQNNVSELQKNLHNITNEYEQLQRKDKQWKQCFAENVEYIHRLTGKNNGNELIKQDLEKVQNINYDLNTMRYYMIGLNNIVDNIDRRKTSANTEEVMAIINSGNRQSLDMHLGKAQRESMVPPRPPSLALTESVEVSVTNRDVSSRRKQTKRNVSSRMSQRLMMFETPTN